MTDEAQTNSQNLTEEQKLTAIRLANGELLRRKLLVENYRINVQRENEIIYVIYMDKEVPEGARGVVGKHPALEVEISAEDMQLMRSYFVR